MNQLCYIDLIDGSLKMKHVFSISYINTLKKFSWTESSDRISDKPHSMLNLAVTMYFVAVSIIAII